MGLPCQGVGFSARSMAGANSFQSVLTKYDGDTWKEICAWGAGRWVIWGISSRVDVGDGGSRVVETVLSWSSVLS